MTAEVIARAILMAGALLLTLGPGLQARLEMSEYHELLASLVDSDLPAETQEYLRLLAIGPSLALRSPLGLLEFLTGPSDWYPQYRSARRAFASSDAAADERVVQIRTHLTRARNWSIVVLGSVLIFAGATLELVQTLVHGQG
jgi:hypothetical protein